MNSSESEEDFESADEDLDSTNPLDHGDENEDVKDSENNGKENSSLATSSTNILNKLEQVNFKEESETKPRADNIITKVEDDSENAKNAVVLDTAKIEEPKVISPLKKRDMKMTTNESSSQSKEDDSQSKTESQNKKSIREKKVKPMKLGMKLTSDVINGNIGLENSTKLLSDTNQDSETKQMLTKYEGSPTNKSATIDNVGKFSHDTVKPEENNFESGDGWELEEEDGFEIPITLAKTGDGAIQCPQEQICELDQVEFRPSKTEEEQSWGGWGGWGVSSLLSTATGTVSTFSNHVTAGLSTVLETTVTSPQPETATGQGVQDNEEIRTNCDQIDPKYGGLGSIMSGVSLLGSSVINRGLDTLETIGKKTMEVLQEGDPGLKKKRALLFQDQDKPILSQILREAKEKADSSDKEKEEKEAARKVHFESLFDDFQGMVHLEALEMLSTQCQLKLQSLQQSHSGSQLLDLQETLSQVRDLCELAEEEEDAEALSAEEFAEKVTNCTDGLRIKFTPVKIIKVNSEICERLGQVSPSTTAVNQTAILSLAELTAAAMECFHKSAELVMAKPIHNTADEADSYVRLTNHLCARVSSVANDFTQLLTKNDPIANSSLITNIFLEASNSCSYIKNACQLLVPILQVGTVAS